MKTETQAIGGLQQNWLQYDLQCALKIFMDDGKRESHIILHLEMLVACP